MVIYRKKNQGRIAAYMGLYRDTPPYKHTPKQVTAYIKKARNIPGGTFITGIGFYEGGQEPTSQIIFVNGGRYAKPTFDEFRSLVREFVKRLAKRFGQRVILMEELESEKSYRVSEWVEYSAFATKKDLRDEKKLLRQMVRAGIAEAIHESV
jgi:hypothetical protein